MIPAETVLVHRYKLLNILGEGGAAIVYRAEDLRLGRIVAVKVLRPAYVADAEQAARFENEARAAAALSAPNVVDVYDYGRDAGTLFIVMQYIDGKDLKHLIQAHGRLPAPEVVRIAVSVCHGLEAAHERGLIHRDVKPQNILIDTHGQVRLTDFGVAKALGGPGLTQAGMTYGTAAYLSPEQATGGPISPATDIYALGIVLYEMLCGHPPFDGDMAAVIAYKQVYEAPPPLRDCAPDVPAALETVVGRALQKDPAARYPTAAALAQALEDSLHAAPGVTPSWPAGAAPVSTGFAPAPLPAAVSAPAAAPAAIPVATGAPVAGAAPGGVGPAPYQSTAAYPAVAPPPPGFNTWNGAVAAQTARPRRFGLAWLAIPLLALLLVGGLLLGGRLPGSNSGGPAPPATASPSPAPTGINAGVPTPATVPVAGGPPATAVPAPPSATPVAIVMPSDTPVSPPGPPPADTPVPPTSPADTPAPPPPTDTPAPPPPGPTSPPAAPTTSGSRGRPVFDTPTPPTGTNRRVVLEDVAFSGGYRYPPPSIYDGRTAVWIYGQGTPFAAMAAPFKIAGQPTGTATLQVTGLDSEDKAKTPLRILINGQVIFNGPDPLPNDYSPAAGTWGTATWTFPAALLHPGDNTLALENLSPSANMGIPFIMLDTAQLTWDAEQ